MTGIAHETLHVASDETPRIQEGHILSDHILSDYIERCVCQSHCAETEVTAQRFGTNSVLDPVPLPDFAACA
jgi:hypothetical protein